MKSLNFEGQMLIDFSRMKRIVNRAKSLCLLKQSIRDLKYNCIDEAKEKIITVYELISESCHEAFIVVDGLVPFVLNEEADNRNHNKLEAITKQIYANYSVLFKLDSKTYCEDNIVSYRKFQLRRMGKQLSNILCLIEETE